MSKTKEASLERKKPYLVVNRYGGRYWTGANPRFETIAEAEEYVKNQLKRPHSTVTIYVAIDVYRGGEL